MIRFNEVSLEFWPGVVRIHQGYETEDHQTIELTVDQMESFILALETASKDAELLGIEFQERERSKSTEKAQMASTKLAK